MRVSGFTIARNIVKYGYPFKESVKSILPICDEFIINLGHSDDATEEVVNSLKDPKIKVIKNEWDFSQGKEVLSYQTNLAMEACQGDWGFYLQADEVIHERDLLRIKRCMEQALQDPDVDALRFSWLHFYGSYWRYRIDKGWYQKQDRIVRLNGKIESYGDAYAFRRKDKKDLGRKHTRCFVYHYGWVQSGAMMAQRRLNAKQIGFISQEEGEGQFLYDFGNLERFPVYFGTHPAVMAEKVSLHDVSQRDWQRIRRKYWWHPLFIGRIRWKTPKRVRVALS